MDTRIKAIKDMCAMAESNYNSTILSGNVVLMPSASARVCAFKECLAVLENSPEVYIEVLGEDKIIECSDDISDVIEKIIKEYSGQEVCTGEFLNNLSIHGMSIEDIVIIYAKVCNRIDGDKVVRKSSGYEVDFVNDYDNY